MQTAWMCLCPISYAQLSSVSFSNDTLDVDINQAVPSQAQASHTFAKCVSRDSLNRCLVKDKRKRVAFDALAASPSGKPSFEQPVGSSTISKREGMPTKHNECLAHSCIVEHFLHIKHILWIFSLLEIIDSVLFATK